MYDGAVGRLGRDARRPPVAVRAMDFPDAPGPRPGGVLVSLDSRRAPHRAPTPGHPDRGPVRASTTPRPRWASSATAATRSWPILDSTMAGTEPARVHARPFDVPFVATLDEALERPGPPDGLLIGIAPTGGRLPGDWRATILEAIRAGLDIHSGLHQFLGDDPEFAAAAAAAGTQLIDYRRPPDRMETIRRAAAPAGQASDPDRRHGLRHRQDVRGPGAGRGRPTGRRLGGDGPDRPDRDDDRGLGRGRRPGHQRLHERDRRVAGRAGRGARPTG